MLVTVPHPGLNHTVLLLQYFSGYVPGCTPTEHKKKKNDYSRHERDTTNA